MIKAVIFDAGGVIVDCKKLLNLFLKVFKPVDKDKFWQDINLKALPLCRGEMSEQDYWKEIARTVGMQDNIPTDLWTHDYETLSSFDKDVLDLVTSLRKKYKTAMISNTIEPHAIINRKRGLFDHFDVVTLSHELKMTKDMDDIFLITINKLGMNADECAFIDDIQKFVDTSTSLGMKGILFKDIQQLKEDLLNLGVTY